MIVDFPVCCSCCCCCRRKKVKPASCAGSQPAEQRAFGSELCGREPALPAFSTDAPAYNASSLSRVFAYFVGERTVANTTPIILRRDELVECSLIPGVDGVFIFEQPQSYRTLPLRTQEAWANKAFRPLGVGAAAPGRKTRLTLTVTPFHVELKKTTSTPTAR